MSATHKSTLGDYRGEQLLEYTTLLAAHDWLYEYSDDARVWRAGHLQRRRLLLLQPHVDRDFALWNKHAPTEQRRTPP